VIAPPVHWRFFIEAHDETDALIRVLTPLAVQGAQLVQVSQGRAAEGVSIYVEAQGLSAGRAETVLRRLQGMPVVLRVAMGWRTGAAAASDQCSAAPAEVR